MYWEHGRDTYTSRTTSGSTRVRSSSSLRSLQHTPERPGICLSHLAGSGTSPQAGPCSLIGQTGGFLLAAVSPALRCGRGTDGAEDWEEDIFCVQKSLKRRRRRGNGQQMGRWCVRSRVGGYALRATGSQEETETAEQDRHCEDHPRPFHFARDALKFIASKFQPISEALTNILF